MKKLVILLVLVSGSAEAQLPWCGHVGQMPCPQQAPPPPAWTGTNPGQLNPGTVPGNMCHPKLICNQYGQCQQVVVCN